MIELTEQQLDAIGSAAEPPRLVNPQTQETFVLLTTAEYERLKHDDYDDSPWTKEELQALAWERIKNDGEEWSEYDDIPEKS